MNPCIVVNVFPSISETFIHRQAAALGCPVVTMYRKTEDEKHFSFDYNKVLALENDHAFESSFEKVIRRMRRRPCRLWRPSSKSKFSEFLSDKNITVVLAQFGPNGINALEPCKKLNVPLVIQFLGYDASELMQNVWYRAEIAKALQYASAVVVLFEGMAVPLRELGCAPSKISVLNIGVPVEDFEATKRPLVNTFEFIAVGRLVEKKSPISTLKAFERCVQANPACRLTMVGGGPLYNDVVSYIEKSNTLSSANVRLPGFLSQKALAKFYRDAHCFLQHSVTDMNGNQEGWPVGIAEACASGLPVISTRHAGITDQVLHGETGYLVTVNDWQTMADHMILLSRDLVLCESMGAKARQHIEKHGNQAIQIEKLLKVLHTASNKL